MSDEFGDGEAVWSRVGTAVRALAAASSHEALRPAVVDALEVLARLADAPGAHLRSVEAYTERPEIVASWPPGRDPCQHEPPTVVELRGRQLVLGELQLEGVVPDRWRDASDTVVAALNQALAIDDLGQRFSAAFDHALIGFTIRRHDGILVACNSTYARMIGDSVDNLIGSRPPTVVHPDDIERVHNEVHAMFDGETDHLATEFRVAADEPTWTRSSSSVVRRPDGTPRYVIAVFEDITEQRLARMELERAAREDALTGLVNRATLLATIRDVLVRSDPSVAVALLFVDVDRFKSVNDTLGHVTGDVVLTTVAERMPAVLRESGRVGRLGGDEFVLVLDGDDACDAVRWAEQLRSELTAPIETPRGPLTIGVSIGVAWRRFEGQDASELLRDADRAMYRAKRLGRDRVVEFDDDLRRITSRREAVETGVRSALEAGELELSVEPEIDLDSGRLLGVEVLVSWTDPVHGPIGGHEIVPLAEESGLITDIDCWVLDTAIGWRALWNDVAPDLLMRVNVSRRSLAAKGYVDAVTAALQRRELSPAALCLEVTETAFERDLGDVVATLERLRDLGVGLAIDDFGTGYSSMTQLRMFPVDTVKIDRSFVSALPASGHDEAIVSSVLHLAEAMGLTVVAEGVETRAQRERLVGLGCARGQGSLFGGPTPIARFDPAAGTFGQARVNDH